MTETKLMFSSSGVELPRVTEKKKRSFAGQKLTILHPLELTQVIRPVQPLIFIHPPKTGGTNLVFIAEALDKRFSTFKARRFAVPLVLNRSPNLVYPGWIGGMEAALKALDAKADCCAGLDFISGHFPFGLHRHITNSAKYVAMIRDPLERALSSVNFDFQRGFIGSEQAQTYLLEAEVDNPQTRMLAGQEHMTGVCDQTVLVKAKENVEKSFLLLGVTEDVETFIQVLASIQGWGSVAISKSQVTGDKVIHQLSPEAREALSSKHQVDIQLYAWAKQRWLDWKEKTISPTPLVNSPRNKILCIMPNFANTKIPQFLTEDEIQQHNAKASADLVELSQHHAGRPGELPARSANVGKTSYWRYGLGAAMFLGLGLFVAYRFNKSGSGISPLEAKKANVHANIK